MGKTVQTVHKSTQGLWGLGGGAVFWSHAGQGPLGGKDRGDPHSHILLGGGEPGDPMMPTVNCLGIGFGSKTYSGPQKWAGLGEQERF